MSTLSESPIVIRELDDYGIPHPPLWARFSGPELTYCIGVLPDGKPRCWHREAREDAETFGARVTRDIVEAHQTGARCCVVMVA